MSVLARKARAVRDLARAVGAVRRARLAVARRPIGALVGAEPQAPEMPPPSAAIVPAPADRQRGLRWASAVDRALRILPGDAACLIRSQALRELLAADGLVGAAVRIGVRRGPKGFEAHAWVELDGMPIAEPASLRGAFASFDRVTIR